MVYTRFLFFITCKFLGHQKGIHKQKNILWCFYLQKGIATLKQAQWRERSRNHFWKLKQGKATPKDIHDVLTRCTHSMGYAMPSEDPLPLVLNSGAFRSDFEGETRGERPTRCVIYTSSYFFTKTKLVNVTSLLKELTNAFDLLDHLLFHLGNFQII